MAIDREERSLDLQSQGLGVPPVFPKPPQKPLDVHVARAAANNLKLNTVNLNYEIRDIVIAKGIEFHDADIEGHITRDEPSNPALAAQLRGTLTVPHSLPLDFPDIVLQDDRHAVFISDEQRVEFHIRVVDTKPEFKAALETPGIHVVYTGHARWGRGPCFGPDLPGPNHSDKTGDNWEDGTDPVNFGLFHMGFPFLGLPFSEPLEHKYKFHPVPASVKVNPADIDNTLTVPGSLRKIRLRGSALEPFVADPLVDEYWGCDTVEGAGLLIKAGFENTQSSPLDLGATNIQCRCISLCSCESFDHFHGILRKRKG